MHEYVFMYVCMYVCMKICMYTCMHTPTGIHMQKGNTNTHSGVGAKRSSRERVSCTMAFFTCRSAKFGGIWRDVSAKDCA